MVGDHASLPQETVSMAMEPKNLYTPVIHLWIQKTRREIPILGSWGFMAIDIYIFDHQYW